MRRFTLPIIIVAFFMLVIIGGSLIGLYTDWLWFLDLGYGGIFSTILLTKIKIGLLFGFLFFAIIYSNLWYARRIAPPPSRMSMEQQLLERLGRLARRGIGLVIFFGSIIVSAMVGLEAATHWQEWLKYFNSTPFGTVDPVFHKDIGFYVFKLPFLSYFYHWLFFALLVAAIASVAIHYADEALEMLGSSVQFAPKVKTHLGILVAAMFFLKAWGYRLSMYDLLNTRNDLFDGAGYTAVHANLPAFWILMVISIIAGLMVLVNTKKRGIGLASMGLFLLVGSSLVIGAGYPALVQKYNVSPNELQKENPYIKKAISATREGYGLTTVAARPFSADSSLTPQQVENNQSTIENVRLWDQDHLQSVYNQLETIQQYYHFTDVDVDRYWLSDKNGSEKHYRQVWLSARELDQDTLPPNSQTWVNLHLQYTHGYGFCMSPVNEVSSEGLPVSFVYDIPPKTTMDISIKNPSTYFGELTKDYVFVKTSAKEFDYPAGSEIKATAYEGNGGVGVGNIFKRLIFAIRFSDINMLLNQNFTSDSKILFRREVDERIRTLFPFLQFDDDPYLVTVKGKLYWMRDAYTMSDAYPYSKHTGTDDYDFNYIRNSVKIVVDAYTGNVDAYAVDRPLPDPMIKTYQKIFPGAFKPLSSMPSELRDHIRYPEDLFRVQTDIYRRYHMDDPVVFYNNSDLWEIPKKAEVAGNTSDQQMDPYYVIMRLPNEQNEEFILMMPYTRAGKYNMVSWMCAKCDGASYGKLVLYQFPKDKNVFGPQQVASRASQDTVISSQLTLWSQQGSNVSSGNLLVIPIESSLLYVMPVYLEAASTKIPELKRVIVSLGNKVAMEPSLSEALADIVGEPVSVPEPTAAPSKFGKSGQPKVPGLTTTKLSSDVTDLINQAVSQYDKAQNAQKNGDWAEYGKQINSLKKTLSDLQSKSK